MIKTLEQIEVGDKVWVGSNAVPHRHLRAVAKVAKGEIVDEGGWRFRRDNLKLIDRGDRFTRITGVATPEELAEWEAGQEKNRRRAEELRLRASKRQDLRALFGENAHVEEADFPERGEWQVTLYGSEDDMRRVAEVLREIIK